MNPAFKFFAREAFGYPETNPPHTPLVAPFFSNALPGFIEIAYICLVVHRFQFFLYQDNNTSSDAWQKSLNSCLNYQLWKVFPAHSIATIIYVMTATKLVARGYPGHWVVYNVPLWTRLLGSLYKRPHLGNPPPWPFH